MKVLHVFYTFLPDITGSSIRSAGLVVGQVANDIPLVAITSPFQPGSESNELDQFHGVRVYRTHQVAGLGVSGRPSSFSIRLRKLFALPRFAWVVQRIARNEGATTIHAHGTFFCAFAGYFASRLLGLQYVYEFRSLWEERGKNAGFGHALQSRAIRWMETLALRLADHVVTINEGLRREIEARGVPPTKITVVPNGVDDDLIRQGRGMPAPRRVSRFGYVGSYSTIEGLDLLIRAFCKAFPLEVDVRLALYGSGPCEEELVALVAQLGDSRVHLKGTFTREQIESVYREIDCIVLPRRRSKLTESVTPLKPLEAMAFSRLVAVSDVGGLLEVIGDKGNAITFPADDEGAIVNFLRSAYRGEYLVESTAKLGNTYVERDRGWAQLARRYASAYQIPAK